MRNALFTPFLLGDLRLPNRILMAPLTRSRAKQPGDAPTEFNARYYAQRASAGLIITEATNISPMARGFALTPGIYTPEQVAGWRLVTDAVHVAGGRIVLQLWHVGRASHECLLGGAAPLSPSGIAGDCRVWVIDDDGEGRMVEASPPRAMSLAEVRTTIEDYGRAAALARQAGFDGVEIHAANGYLPEQFLSTNTNHRTDAYGGALANRARFLLETVEAAAESFPLSRIGVRLSPLGPVNEIADDDPAATYAYAARRLSELGLGYVHLADTGALRGAPRLTDILGFMRPAFPGPLLVNGGLSADAASDLIDRGLADLAAFGRAFLANPDLPERLRRGAPLNAPDPASFYGGGAAGYVDYPALESSTV